MNMFWVMDWEIVVLEILLEMISKVLCGSN